MGNDGENAPRSTLPARKAGLGARRAICVKRRASWLRIRACTLRKAPCRLPPRIRSAPTYNRYRALSMRHVQLHGAWEVGCQRVIAPPRPWGCQKEGCRSEAPPSERAAESPSRRARAGRLEYGCTLELAVSRVDPVCEPQPAGESVSRSGSPRSGRVRSEFWGWRGRCGWVDGWWGKCP